MELTTFKIIEEKITLLLESLKTKHTHSDSLFKELTDIKDEISIVWDNLRNKKYTSKDEVYLRLSQINSNLTALLEKENIYEGYYRSFFELSQLILDLHELMRASPGEDFTMISVLLSYGTKEDVYFIFNKEAVKAWATHLDWFFMAYNRCEIIYEDTDYTLIKSTLASNLGFTANIILDKDMQLLGEKYNKEKTALEFFGKVSELNLLNTP